MDINWNLHPLEIVRKIKCFYKDSLSDFEIRHPETRRRLALELKIKISPQDRSIFQSLIKRFEGAKAVISVFDWPVLIEWNEWRLQGEILFEIESRLQNLSLSSSPYPMESLQQRMSEILSEIRTHPLVDDPSFFTCILFRWKFSSLRQEARYYCERWDAIQSQGAVAS